MKLVIASVISLLSFSALAAPEGTLSVHILNQQTVGFTAVRLSAQQCPYATITIGGQIAR
jgi:hypothetical protein